MVKALQLNAIKWFKRFYRSVDALLIDDIQFLPGKKGVTGGIFHTFNALLEGGQQMIPTCDRYPKEIDHMEERLSRFEMGINRDGWTTWIGKRVAILMKKADQAKVNSLLNQPFYCSKDLIECQRVEGALKLVIANGIFTGQEINPVFIRECLKRFVGLHDK